MAVVVCLLTAITPAAADDDTVPAVVGDGSTTEPNPAIQSETAEAEPLRHVASDEAIHLRADYSQEWHAGSHSVAILRGRCVLAQGHTVASGQSMVVRQSRVSGRPRLEVYLEGDVRLEQPGQSRAEHWLKLSLESASEILLEVPRRSRDHAAENDPLYQRALAQWKPRRTGLRQTQLVVPPAPDEGPELRSVQIEPPAGNLRRIRISPRSALPFNFQSFRSNLTTPPEQVWILVGGINVIVEGVRGLDTVDLAADRAVIWTSTRGDGEFRSETLQTRDEPFTIYLEGNIVIRQGTHVLRATQAVYDAREERALLLDADLRSYIPELQGDVRVRARRLRQLSDDSFYAQHAWTTTSQFGKPGYRLQAAEVYLENRLTSSPFGLGPAEYDPFTGAPVYREVPWITSLGNTFYVDDVPLLYFPRISGPAEDPNIPLRRISVEQDSIFGGQLRTVWDMHQLLGLDAPAGNRWDLLADYLTDRGPAVGTGGSYSGSHLFGCGDVYRGEGLLYYIHDDGDDNLGADRRSLPPEHDDRYRALLRHRHDFPNRIKVLGEFGLISDRNFLEQYYENEFDEDKDNETLLYSTQSIDNFAWSLLSRPQLNDFETTTEWAPKGDLYLLSQPLLSGLLTWSTHTSAGYGNLEPADPPFNPLEDIFAPLPFVADVEGAVLMSRHELNAPFLLGPVNVVPFALGEAAFWSEDFTGDELDRFVGSIGLRSSLMFWRAFPYVQSRVFNLNGLAHKVRLEAEYALTESTEDLSNIPQYNEFDDNAQERFRNRFLINTFGGVLPPQFEPRFYAVRTGAGRAVTVPWHELIDDQQAFRLALRQRLQTKVGPPERLRIKDWMTLDLETSIFPDPADDNFGEAFGLIGGRYRWLVGDRTRLLANAFYDLFDGGQELWDVGVLTQRSERGSLYLGLRQVKGAELDSKIVTASYTYKMSPKWVSTFGTAYDLDEDRNAGQSLTITRIGADWLVHLGAGFDASKDNASIAISVEPRIGAYLSQTQLGSLLGLR